jgi:hypothetical protein
MTTWLPVETVARLLPQQPSTRHVRRLATRGHFGEIQRMGRHIAIDADQLPKEARARLVAEQPAEHTIEPAPRAWADARPEQRERALIREAAVRDWQRFLEELPRGRGRSQAKRRWLTGYKLQNAIERLSLASVRRWAALYDAHGRDGLLDGNDGSARREQFSIPRRALNFFHARYLDKHAPPTIARAIEDTRLEFGCGAISGALCEKADCQLPHADDPFYRYVRSYIPESVRLACRDAVDSPSLFLPYVQRAMEEPYRTLQSDHHIADVFVNCEGSLCADVSSCRGHRPWWTPMMDVGSRKIVAWQVSLETPNSERILRAFRLAVEAEGLPDRLYIDNGKDFKKAAGKGLTAGEEEYLGHRMKMLGIKVVFAKPYNAQAKEIERFFGSFVSRRWQGSEGYTGRLGRRSERTQYLCKHPEQLTPFSVFVGYLADAIAIYNTTPHKGVGMKGRTPAEVLAAPRARREPDKLAFQLVFWSCSKRVLDRNGIRLANFTYTPVDPDGAVFERYFRKTIKVLVDPADVSRAILCNEDEQFLCEARALELATHDTEDAVTQAAMDSVLRRRKVIKGRLYGEDTEARLQLRTFKHQYAAIFHREAERRREQERLLVASAGASVASTVLLPGMSRVARDLERARTEIASNALSPEKLAKAALVEDLTDEYLDALDRRPRLVRADDDEEDELALATEKERVRAAAERRRKEREGECLDCTEPVWAGSYCVKHHRLSE